MDFHKITVHFILTPHARASFFNCQPVRRLTTLLSSWMGRKNILGDHRRRHIPSMAAKHTGTPPSTQTPVMVPLELKPAKQILGISPVAESQDGQISTTTTTLPKAGTALRAPER